MESYWLQTSVSISGEMSVDSERKKVITKAALYGLPRIATLFSMRINTGLSPGTSPYSPAVTQCETGC